MSMDTDTTKPLCPLCSEFTQKLAAGVRKDNKSNSYPPTSDGTRFNVAEWRDSMTLWNGVYKHYSSLAELVSSAENCSLCRLLKEDFERLAGTTKTSQMKEYCDGWLGLYFHGSNAYTTESGGLLASGETFRAGFSESLTRMPPRKAPNINPPLMFRVCLRDRTCPLRKSGIAPSTARRIPEDGAAPGLFDLANAWLAECLKSHPECRERTSSTTSTAGGDNEGSSSLLHEQECEPLPTRVLDVDPALGDKVKLHISQGKRAPYVALSHCWGGNIPNKTIKSTLEESQRGIEISSLPRNFQDAIHITRKLNFRYVWIDAMCIVQDDPADWAREADLMDEVYSYSTVTITGLDSPSSTAGILRRRRLASVDLPDLPYAIQACTDNPFAALRACVLSGRAWCLQERFLAPRLLHFGAAQTFWECRGALAAEDDRPLDFQGSTLTVSNLVQLHRELGHASPPTGDKWYKLVEEYSTRRLTFGTDKLPAMVGMSQMFRARNAGLGQYVVGLWSGDLGRGLCWGPSLLQFNQDRKRPGYVGNDLLAEFTRPEKPRAPSWSWASVDGSLYFPCSRTFIKPWVGELEVLDIQMDEKGCAGKLTLRGRVGGVFDYQEPQKTENVALGEVGWLRKKGDGGYVAGACVLDFDRHRSRTDCYALLAASSDMPRKFVGYVVLEKIAEGRFKRIGVAIDYRWPGESADREFREKIDELKMQQLSIE